MKVISAFGVYSIYCALKTHFTVESYDFFKYKGKLSNLSFSDFEARKDKNCFEYLRKKFNYNVEEIIKYMIANFINDKNSIYEFDYDIYLKWCSDIQACDYRLKTAMRDYEITEENIIEKKTKQGYPFLFDLLLKNKINIESFILLDNKFKFSELCDNSMPEPFLWKKYKLRCEKYRPFMEKYV